MILIADDSAVRTIAERGLLAAVAAKVKRILIPDLLIEPLKSDGTLDALIEAGGDTLFEVVSLTEADMAAAEYYQNEGGAPLALMARLDLGADAFLTERSALRTASHIEGYNTLTVDELLAGVAPHGGAVMPPSADLLHTVTLNEEDRRLIEQLIERGVGRDADDVVRRALRGLAATLLSS